MQKLLQDLRFAVRLILKNPGFSVATVVVLALGIGANTAIFSVVHSVLLRPLPFSEPERLVQIWHTPPAKSFPGIPRFSVSAANYLDWKQQNQSFERTAVYSHGGFTVTGQGQPEAITAAQVEPDFFAVLRAHPMMGRVFAPGEVQAGSNVVILSHRYWKERLGSDPHVIGKQLSLDGQSNTIIGVMNSGVRVPGWAQIWTPLVMTAREKAVRGEHHFLVIARLKPNVDMKQAQAEMDTISKRLEQQYPEDNNGWGAIVVPLRDEIVGDVRPALLILFGAVALVLLIACANVANLVLAKTLSREKEMAIRAALGASRSRMFQQLLSETVLLSLIGGAVGLFVSKFGILLITKFLADRLPRSAEVGLNTWVLLFTLIIAVLTGIVAGLAPAWHLTKTDVNDALKQGGGKTSVIAGGRRTRNLLVVSEVALSVMLLIAAGLMIRSLWRLQRVDPGFDPRNLLTMTVSIRDAKFHDATQEGAALQELLRRVRNLPGVRGAGVVDDLPLVGGSTQPIAIEGYPAASLADQPEVAVRRASAGYFETMRIPLTQGRTFNESDTPDSLPAIVISESMAKRFWPGQDPIGKRLTMTFFPSKVRQVVGVVGDVKQFGLDYDQTVPTLYWPTSQMDPPAEKLGEFRSYSVSLVVRTDSAVTTVAPQVTATVRQLDPDYTLLDVMPMDEFVSETLTQQRFTMMLLVTFAAVALVLAAVGIYSVLAYSVRQRMHDIGIRMALGAQVKDVVRLVLYEGLRPTAIGLVIGLAGALALGRVLAAVIFGVKPHDPPTLATVCIVLVVVCFAASLLPAYRASKVEPVKTLREE